MTRFRDFVLAAALLAVSGCSGDGGGGGGERLSASGAGEEPTTTTAQPSGSTVAPTTTPTTVRAAPATVRVAPAPATSTTAAPKPPRLLAAWPGRGAPCPAGTSPEDSCFFFLSIPEDDRGRRYRARSDLGYDSGSISVPDPNCGGPRPGECVFYLGGVYDRAAGQRECFTLTFVDDGRESPESKPQCMVWNGRPD